MVLVDTSVWSLALRRRPGTLAITDRRVVAAWETLVEEGRAALIGPIRQEILSGLRIPATFAQLRQVVASFRMLPIEDQDCDRAAELFNRCRAGGISGGHTDLLIVTVAQRLGVPVFTTDPDFTLYARHVAMRLYQV